MIGNGGQLQHYAAFTVLFYRITNCREKTFLVGMKTALKWTDAQE
jgi:hypothetical protein